MAGHSPAPALAVNGLTFRYPNSTGPKPVLENTSCRLERGEAVALLGRSGSGKSTLLNLLAGLDRAEGGRIAIDGHDLTEMTERARTLFRRRHIGLVYQFFNLLDDLTALENVALVAELNGLERRDALDRAAAMLASVGLADRGHHLPGQLSGGEQQRVSLARALVHGPSLVLADEPTGNLDIATGREMMRLLHHQVRERGATLLLVTHSEEVAAGADRTLVLEDGFLSGGEPAL